MYPVLFEFPGFTFYTQTLLLFLAFLAGLAVALHEGRRFGMPRCALLDVVLWGFVCAIPGARLLYILLNWNSIPLTLNEMCTLGRSGGGFSFHGGLLTGAIGGLLLAWRHKLSFWRLADVLAPGLAIAMFFMRLGCLLNGCDYGVATTMPWGVPLHGAMRHPIQLYEGTGNLLLLPLLLTLNNKPAKHGQVFLLYLFLSSFLRFGVDFYRAEHIMTQWSGLLVPQCIALLIGVTSGAAGLYRFFSAGHQP